MKRGGFGIPDPRLSSKRAYNTSKAASEVLVFSLLGGTDLNYKSHKGWLRRLIADSRNQRESSETEAFTRRKELAGGVGLNCLRRATENEALLIAISHCLDSTELSGEEF